jgi:outer membrane protein OmpA-like peptidoglycan-associated protein
MDMRKATRNVIKKDSVAAIRTEGLVGDQYVEIAFGSIGSPSVNNGDTIRAEQPVQISDMLKRANVMLDSAQVAVQNIDQITSNLNSISATLKSGKGTVGALLNDKSVYQHVNQATANLQEDTEALKHNFLLRGFFKEHGYENPQELTRNAIPQLPKSPPADRLSYPGAKLFDKPEGAKIKDAKMLADAGRYLEHTQFGLAVVAAYAGEKGDSEKQRELTEARAAVVRDYLVQHFKVDDTKIKTFGGGKSADAPDEGRVELIIYAPANAPSPSQGAPQPTKNKAQ